LSSKGLDELAKKEELPSMMEAGRTGLEDFEKLWRC
jgi:hypothetical protein